MPAGIVRGAIAVDTFPPNLSTKFTESTGCQVNINDYRDGSSQRQSLVTSTRRSWNLSQRLTGTQAAQLRAFFEANAANAFYFYSPFETSPPFSRTPAGTEGRYVVRFASDYDQTISMVRSDIPTQLIEISDTTDAPINPGGGGGNPPPVNVPNGAVLSLVTAHTPNGGYTPVFGAIASLDGVSTLSPRPTIFQDNSTYAKRTDTVLIDPNVVIGGALFVLFGLEEDTNHGSSVLSPADTMLVYDAFVTLTYTDGSVFVYRPSGFATQIAQSPATAGAVTGGANAIDTDPNTFATITVTQYTSGLSGAFLSVTNFRRTT